MSTGHEKVWSVENAIVSVDNRSRVIDHVCHKCGDTTGKILADDMLPQGTESARYSPVVCQRGHDGYVRITKAVIAAALALILTTPAHAAPPTFQHPVHPPDTYLAGCAITTYDDGSRVAECPEDGAALVFDADGNRFINDAGAPIRAQGWYVLE